jgi:hypothetical protein
VQDAQIFQKKQASPIEIFQGIQKEQVSQIFQGAQKEQVSQIFQGGPQEA